MTAQDEAESVQVVAGEKFATPLLAHVSTPVGESPETLAVQVAGEPIVAVEGAHDAVTVVTSFTTESEELPELPGLFGSPA